MNKRELLAPFVVAGLAVAFLFVCTMVVLSRSHPEWVQRKLRIGALLLGLTAVTTGTACPVSCYAPITELPPPEEAPVNVFVLEGEDRGSMLVINLAENDTLLADLSYREGDTFSYRLTRGNTLIEPPEVERGDLTAVDGAFDEPLEELEITLPTTLTTGIYYLHLYATTAAQQPGGFGTSFKLDITNE